MAIVVIGGHSRNVGKTSVVAGLIAALPDMNWLAIKVTQYGHGICTADGAPCDCITDDHTMALMEERDTSGATDTSRFLQSGAKRSVWARTRQGYLAELMPRLREQIAQAENVIIESNSIVQFLKPALYLSVLDGSVQDFKLSAREFLDRADALILHSPEGTAWETVSPTLLEHRLVFQIAPPAYVTPELVAFVRSTVMFSNC